MKRHIIAFFHKPHIVAVVSLIIALTIGIVAYRSIHVKPVYQYSQATDGVIASLSDSQSHIQHLTLGFVSGGRVKSISVKPGDIVSSGAILAELDAGNALGALTQAKAAYRTAQANYQKVVNGATSPAIDVAKASVNSAQVSLDQAIVQQDILVKNAYSNLLNSSLQAKTSLQTSPTPPTISGSYKKSTEGVLTIDVREGGSLGYLVFSGIATGTADLSTTTAQPIGDTGLYIKFPSASYVGTTWTIAIPNIEASNYLANKNTYDTALQTKTQTLASLTASLEQAKAVLAQTVSEARPEDIAQAQAQVDNASGALQIAQAAYDNTVIKAPHDGTITGVLVTLGEIATPNTPAIDLLATISSTQVPVMIPTNAVVQRNGKSYVLVKSNTGVEEREVSLGISDSEHVQVLSGVMSGEMVVVHY